MIIDDSVEAVANQIKHRPRPTKIRTTTIVKTSTVESITTEVSKTTTLNDSTLSANVSSEQKMLVIDNDSPKNDSRSEQSPKESRLILLKINETNTEPDDSFRTTINQHERVLNITTRAILNTFVPISEFYNEPCNFDTCQLGKCLKNGTCECIPPAIGKFCDHIDECLVLKCVNVSLFYYLNQ